MTSMGYAYTKFATRRGFKLHHTRKFSVQRLRARITCFFRILATWRHQARRAIKRGICKDYNEDAVRREGRFGSCRKGLVKGENVNSGRLRSFARSNSFYTEAIKECLEFIKRNSVDSTEQSELLTEDRVRETN